MTVQIFRQILLLMQWLICRQYFTDLRENNDNSSFSLYKILCWYQQKNIQVGNGQGESRFYNFECTG
jgi:hypothetical protein